MTRTNLPKCWRREPGHERRRGWCGTDRSLTFAARTTQKVLNLFEPYASAAARAATRRPAAIGSESCAYAGLMRGGAGPWTWRRQALIFRLNAGSDTRV